MDLKLLTDGLLLPALSYNAVQTLISLDIISNIKLYVIKDIDFVLDIGIIVIIDVCGNKVCLRTKI